MHRGFLGLSPKGLSYVEDAGFGHCILYNGAGSDGGEQFVLRDDPAGMIDKMFEDGERLRRVGRAGPAAIRIDLRHPEKMTKTV
jgi:hypothetical protein